MPKAFRRLWLLGALVVLTAATQDASPADTPHWSTAQAGRLAQWLDSGVEEGLAALAADARDVRAAIAARNADALDSTATAAALHLLEAHRMGCCQAALRTDWHMPDNPADPAPLVSLTAALASNGLDRLVESARPSHPAYVALRDAYRTETDPARRTILAANLDRWRWMPRTLGPRYLIVNAAAFEAGLWDSGRQTGRWHIIVGKTKTPTPTFAATISGVTFNPWWEIPKSIVAESVGAIVRDRPTEAARRGYVVEGGRYRQRPGPANALGLMKLVMPNPYSIYLHDTPSQSLFDRPVRAFSHGCVRVDDALDLATVLLAPAQWTRTKTDALVQSGKTTTLKLTQPLPVYITYFTAEPDGNGGIRYFDDIYRRDRVRPASDVDPACTAEHASRTTGRTDGIQNAIEPVSTNR